MSIPLELSRRERQIMDVIYARGEATASEVLAGIADPPTRSSVRALLRILEHKGHVAHRKQGREFVYVPTRPRGRMGMSALRSVLATFFGGSIKDAFAAHLSDPQSSVSGDELNRIDGLIKEARRKRG